MSDDIPTRMEAAEKAIVTLDELVDGQQEWSHRKRLHRLENTVATESLLQQALDEVRNSRTRRLRDYREWLAWAATVALAVYTLLGR